MPSPAPMSLTSAVSPSPEIATTPPTPWSNDDSAALLKAAVGVELETQASSAETWKMYASPKPLLENGAPTMSVVPSEETDIAPPKRKPPSLTVRVAVGVDV